MGIFNFEKKTFLSNLYSVFNAALLIWPEMKTTRNKV